MIRANVITDVALKVPTKTLKQRVLDAAIGSVFSSSSIGSSQPAPLASTASNSLVQNSNWVPEVFKPRIEKAEQRVGEVMEKATAVVKQVPRSFEERLKGFLDRLPGAVREREVWMEGRRWLFEELIQTELMKVVGGRELDELGWGGELLFPLVSFLEQMMTVVGW
jgi:hypothetical protein